MLLLKRITVFLMAMISLFSTGSTNKYADYCGSYDFPRIAAEKQAQGTVRIMSFNIRCADVNGTPLSDRLDIGVRQILEVMPDSVGIQEATSKWMNTLDRKLDVLYDWVGKDRDNGVDPRDASAGESCPIFYLKARFKLLDNGSFWLSDTPDVPSYGPGAACRRICTWAKLKNRLTGDIYVHVNTHFDHVSEDARVQAGRIVSRFLEDNFSDVPVVFTADMNTSDKGEAYATMTQDLADARQLAAVSVPYGTFHGGKDPHSHADYYIDFILCSDNFRVDAYRTVTKGVDDRFSSDHFPIYADIHFKD